MALNFGANLKPTLIGVAVGAVGLAVLGLSTGWAVTGEKAMQMSEKAGYAAAVEALVPICVAQFQTQPEADQTAHILKLRGVSNWKQDDYVAERGWATMPGQDKPNSAVTDPCAKALLASSK